MFEFYILYSINIHPFEFKSPACLRLAVQFFTHLKIYIYFLFFNKLTFTFSINVGNVASKG